MKWTKLPVFAALITLFVVGGATNECSFGSYDFSPLKNIDWEVKNGTGPSTTAYHISVCGPLTGVDGCGQESAVCRLESPGPDQETPVVIGNSASQLNITEDGTKGELLLYMEGSRCPEDENENKKWTTVIYFKCGRSLGSPALLDTHACATYFEWYSSIACKTPPTAVKEVKCYVYDSEDQKFDLSPLIKKTGGYLVESTNENTDFYINVCRDITAGDETSACPAGSSACAVKSSTSVDAGKPVADLQVTAQGYLSLTYTSDDKPDGCTDNSVTTVTLICPKHDERAGGVHNGRPPILTSDLNCHYEVEWVTEYACPETYTVTKQCKFTLEQHDVDVDLTPLSTKGTPYSINVPSTKGDETYVYDLNVCDELHVVVCLKEDNSDNSGIAACQSKEEDTLFGKSLGQKKTQTLRYSDGELSLTYTGGTLCNHNHFHRSTVINFHCKEGSGTGAPTFSYDDDCTYVFNWDTEYACLNQPPPASQCSVVDGKKRFDLSSLIRDSGDNWQALDSQSDSNSQYFINICHGVVRAGEAEGCAADAAICRKDADGQFYSLGQYSDGPTYNSNTNSIVLTYTQGDSCVTDATKKVRTVVSLKCKPGDLETGPVMTGTSPDLCQYEFVWWTAAACALAKKTGTDCKVYDDEAGFSFDLSPLTKPAGQAGFYEVSTVNHDYYVNVCAGVTGTKCNEGDRASKSSGVCQVDHSDDSRIWNTGQPNTNLTYYDGMITLTYIGGDLYHDQEPRKTQIAFLCDLEAGQGSPEFQDETDHTYSFRWLTAYACPEMPIECVVFDEANNLQYDLSSLSHTSVEDNWSIEDLSDPNNKRKFYINVCRPLTPVAVGTGCEAFAAVCSTEFKDGQEHLKISNMGRAKTKPSLDGDGLVLEYTDGATCSGTTKYTTKIHLKCQKGALTEAPKFLDQGDVNPCEFSFVWETEAACPLVETKGQGDCTVTDSNTEHTYNMAPLYRKDSFYEVTDPDSQKIYKVNICGAVSGCPNLGKRLSAVCEGDTPKAEVSAVLDLSAGQLTLSYRGQSKNQIPTKTIVTFLCDHSTPQGEPVFKGTDGDDLLFDFPTSLACAPDPVDCSVTDDEGNEYDLTRLARETEDWSVVDTRPNRGDLKYFINVCRPLNTAADTGCPGGPIGSCQVTGDGTSHNMGYIQSRPHATADGTLTLQYYGGDKCHSGTDNESYRSTRINFYCSNMEHDPVFESETPECEYIFNWQTPSACPLKKAVGDNCIVEDPLYHVTFDLNLMTLGGTSNTKVTVGEYTYLLNVCGPLNDAPGDCKGNDVGACQTKPSDPAYSVNAGKYNTRLMYEDGDLKLVYSDGKGDCHDKYDRTTIIKFVCDHNPVGGSSPHYIKEDYDCTYIFEWRTAYACMPFNLGQCSVADDSGNSYDLSRLTLTDGNYEYEQSTPHLKFLINVCTVMVHGKGATCPPNTAVCLVNMTDTSKTTYVSLGEPNAHQLTIQNGGDASKLLLTYDNGESCGTGNGAKRKKTYVYLVCKEGAIDTHPAFEFQEDNCEFTFNWETEVACPLTPQEPVSDDCLVRNPDTDYEFSLKSLSQGQGYAIQNNRGHTFNINVCAPLDNPGDCGEHSGSCQRETTGTQMWNAGNANSKLHYIDGILMLNYTDGKKCHHNDLPRNTVINFVCGAEGVGQGEPVFVDETDDCTYYISWHTELACERHVKCEVEYKGQVIDLSPLTKASGYHIATSATDDDTDTDTAYYVNICRPLNPIQGVLCPPEASVCQKSGTGSPVSLGRVEEVPYIDSETDKVAISFKQGSKCGQNQEKFRTSKIIFSCEPGLSEGTPELVSVSDDGCDYMFEWSTNTVCLEAPPVVRKNNCTYTDSRTLHTYDFSQLIKSGSEQSYQVTGKNTYLLNMCEPVVGSASSKPGCKGAAVCRLDEANNAVSMGSADQVKFVMEGDDIKMIYANGATCSDGTDGRYSAIVLMECSHDVRELGQPEYFFDSTCTVMLKWRTPLACLPVIEQCLLTHQGATYDLSLLSRADSSWLITDNNHNSYWLNICRGIYQGPSGCQQGAAVCREDAKGEVDVLGQLETQQIYMDTDGETLVVHYTHGSNACSHDERRSDRSSASVKIYLKCTKTTGVPELVEKRSSGSHDSCLFEFEWHTHLACKEQRIEVKEEHGIIRDMDSDTGFDIGPLMKLQKTIPDYSLSDVQYVIELAGQSNMTGCQGASVCKTKQGSPSLNIGAYHSRKFYMQGDSLEMEAASTTPCDTDSGTTFKSIINFQCNSQQLEPFLVYRSKSCHCVFTWSTPTVCQSLDLSREHPSDSSGGGGGGAKSSTVGLVLGIISIVIVAVVLAVVFHKKERRSAFASRIRVCLNRSKFRGRFQYTHLVQAENSTHSLLGGATGGYGTDVEDAGGVQAFHEDSDEDMLL